MLASVTATVLNLIKLDLKARLRALTVSAVLTLVGVVLLLTAIGFGVALLYVWLEQMWGAILALATIAGGCAVLALILFAVAAWRPKPGGKRARRAAAVAPPRPDSTGSAATTDRMMDEALSAMQQGSREQLLAALSLALVTGIILGRKV